MEGEDGGMHCEQVNWDEETTALIKDMDEEEQAPVGREQP